MKIDRILTELVIFAREHDGDSQPETRDLIKAAERHLDAVQRIRARRARFSHKHECERCEGPSSSGILCWDCLGVAPSAIRHAFRDASGVDGIRLAAGQVRTWIRIGDDYEPLPTGDALQSYWIDKLPAGESQVLQGVLSKPDGISRDEISELTTFKRSTRNTYIQRLSARELVRVQGETVYPSDSLFD